MLDILLLLLLLLPLSFELFFELFSLILRENLHLSLISALSFPLTDFLLFLDQHLKSLRLLLFETQVMAPLGLVVFELFLYEFLHLLLLSVQDFPSLEVILSFVFYLSFPFLDKPLVVLFRSGSVLQL